MENGFKDELTERLMRYTAIDSQSDELSNKSPSTDQQLDAKLIEGRASCFRS